MRWESRHVKTILMSSLPPLPDISNGDNVRLTFVESILLCVMAGGTDPLKRVSSVEAQHYAASSLSPAVSFSWFIAVGGVE